MTVNTKRITNRRKLQFESLDQVLTEARRLVDVPYKKLGNWSLGQVLNHLAVGCEIAVDGTSMKVPWLFRIVARVMKKKILNSKMKPGFKFTKAMRPFLEPPIDISDRDGLAAFEKAVQKMQGTSQRAPSPAFGELTVDEYNQLTLRHCELHLSFIEPVE